MTRKTDRKTSRRQIQHIDPDEVYRVLHTHETGLNDRAVTERLRELGPNSFDVRDPYKTAKIFIKQFTNFFTILLEIAAIICFVADTIQPGESMNILGFTLLGVSVLNALFSFIQEYRAEKAMEALKKFLPQMVKIRRNGKIEQIPADGIVPGDVVLLSEGDRVAADARIVSSKNLLVNNAPLTGESHPVGLVSKAEKKRLLDSRNIAFAGCSVLRGSAEAVVFATGLRTEFGKLARLSQAIKRSRSPLEKETSHMVRVLTAVATTMGISFFFYGVFSGQPIWINLVFMMGIIVANVPEGLLPTFTLALAIGSLRMAKKNVLVKGLNAVEGLGAVHVICTDKTGTLTLNRLSLTKMYDHAKNPLSKTGEIRLLEFAGYASEMIETEGGKSGDPLDIEIFEQLAKRSKKRVPGLPLKYFPFDTDLRRSGSLVTLNGSPFRPVKSKRDAKGGGRNENWYVVKGAWEVIAPMLDRFATGDDLSRTIKADRELIKRGETTMKAMARSGLRVLCVAAGKKPDRKRGASAIKQKELETGLTFLGFLGIEDPVRKEVPGAVAKCKTAGIETILITGDHPDTAISVALQCGIVDSDRTLYRTGAELETMTEDRLIEEIEAGVRIFARSTPEQKMKIVSALKKMEKVTAMTGDGVNDAPALKAADVGIAMGKGGTDVARESAQIILLDDNFASIVSGIEEGRTVFANIRKFTNYVLVSNGPEIIPYLLYIVLPVPLALNVIHILSIDLGTDIIPSMGLGQEPPDPAEMKRPPRQTEKNLLSAGLLLHSYLFLGLLEGFWSLFLFFYTLVEGGWQYGERLTEKEPLLRSAMGIALATILLMQIGNLIGRRYRFRSGLDAGIFKNSFILAGIVIQIVFSLALLYVPPVQKVLHTGPVPFSTYLLACTGIFLIYGADYLRKWIAIKIQANPNARPSPP